MPADLPTAADVVVVGGGPAGLAAASELKRLGVPSVVVLERENEAGGIPRHCGDSVFGMREFQRVLRGQTYARRLAETAAGAGVAIHTGVTVTALRPGARLEVTSPDGPGEISARHVLLCTGVRERTRAARLIGGTKPGGVVSTGALQGLVHLQKLRPFRRPVVLGTELVSFSALLTCRHAGIRPVAMVAPERRVIARWPAALLPRIMGVPLLLETELVAVEGQSWVTGVEVRDSSGATRRLEADGLIVTGQFQPEASLLRASHLHVDPRSGGPCIDQFGRCSDPAYFAAGNLLRPVETAGWSWNEGRLTARAMARSLAGHLPAPERSLSPRQPEDPIKYVVPHRIVAGTGEAAAHTNFQLRVTRPVTGRLALQVDGREWWSQPLSALPERRISVPLSVLPKDAAGEMTFVLTDER